MLLFFTMHTTKREALPTTETTVSTKPRLRTQVRAGGLLDERRDPVRSPPRGPDGEPLP